MPATDFSFVSEEGWQALRPHFERAEEKLRKKVEKKEMRQDEAERMIKHMWSKYDRWAAGEGKKKKDDQTVIQNSPKATTKKASIEHIARIGRTQLVDILNAITDGTIANPAVFQQTLEMNRISEPEFFQFMAQDVQRYPQLYPKQLTGYFGELFTDWGYQSEVQQVLDAGRGAVGPKPPESFQRQTPEPAQAPAPAAARPAPAPAPAPAQHGETVEDIAPRPQGMPVEPQPWPQELQPPKPSAEGPVYRWYFVFILKGDQAPRAAIADGLNRKDALDFIHQTERSGAAKMRVARPLSEVAGQQAPAAPAPAPAAKAPAAPPAPGEQKTAPATSGPIETPDPSDPNTYRWYFKFKHKNSANAVAQAPDFTSAQMAAMIKRVEQMGMEVLELKKMQQINSSASIVVDDQMLRQAEGGENGPSEKFRNGTPIIFIEDVNLEFDALSARGQIKKNMTGKIKKVEDNDYLIDIAGQLYRVPRLVAEHVMDVFAANVVSPEPEGAEAPAAPGQEQGQNAPAQSEEVLMEPAKPQGQVPGQKPAPQPAAQQPQKPAQPLPPGGAPKMPAGIAAADGRIVVADDELGRLVVSDIEIEAGFETEAMAMNNRAVARAFAEGATRGKGNNMFIDGDTIYSYGRHFPMATRGADGTIYMTTKTYSVSTARHLSYLRSALAQAGLNVVLSDLVDGGRVAVPTPEEIKRHEHEARVQEENDRKRQEKRRLREEKKLTQQRNQVPDESAQGIAEVENTNLDNEAFIQQHDERGRPIKYRIDRTLAPSTPEETVSLNPQQWAARIQDIEDQILRETDPARQEKLRQRLERMKMASWSQAMMRVAGDDGPDGRQDAFLNSKMDVSDLHEVVREKDRNEMKKDEDIVIKNKRPQTAAVKSEAFADLLMLIEQGGPGIPSEIGKRLYRADGAVSRAS